MRTQDPGPSLLRSDIAELLDGFSKRMKFIHIVRSIITTNALPNNIREMFGNDYDVIDNIVMTVLLYIKERTLAYNQKCGLKDIADLLEQLRPVIPSEYEYDADILAEFVVVKVLQNSGLLHQYRTYNDVSQQFEMQTIRLINEEKGQYSLTDDVFDFLYRSKEIESELDYSVTRFMMQEYMKRRNYSEALKQSRELVERLRNLQLSMDNFILRCRENIAKVMIDEYDDILNHYKNLLSSENEELEQLQKTTMKEIGTAQQALQAGADSEDTRKNLLSLEEISDNLAKTIQEQRSLINKWSGFAEIYAQILRDSFRIRSYTHMDFEKDLLVPLQKTDHVLEDFASMFLVPLCKPEFTSVFSIENFYAGGRLSEEEEEENGLDLTASDDDSALIEERNTRFRNITQSFFAYATKHERFRVNQYIRSLSLDAISDMCRENALPNVLLSLYSLQTIDVEKLSKTDGTMFLTEPNGEFDLPNFLRDVREQDKLMKQLSISSARESCRFRIGIGDDTQVIEMTDFLIEVK